MIQKWKRRKGAKFKHTVKTRVSKKYKKEFRSSKLFRNKFERNSVVGNMMTPLAHYGNAPEESLDCLIDHHQDLIYKRGDDNLEEDKELNLMLSDQRQLLEEEKQFEHLENYKRDLSKDAQVYQNRSRSNVSFVKGEFKSTQIDSKMTNRFTPILLFDNKQEPNALDEFSHDNILSKSNKMQENVVEDFNDN